MALTPDELAPPANRIERNLTGAPGHSADRTLLAARPAGAEAAPSR